MCYSYKGGSGRTTAAVNLAFQLYSLGKLVVCLDFDFSAAGMHMVLSEWNPVIGTALEKQAERVGTEGLRLGIQDLMSQTSYSGLKAQLGSSLLAPMEIRGVEQFERPSTGSQLLFGFSSDKTRTISSLNGTGQGYKEFQERFQWLVKAVGDEARSRSGRNDEIVYILVDAPNGIVPGSLALIRESDIVLMFFRYSVQHVRGTVENVRKILRYNRDRKGGYFKVCLVGSCFPEDLHIALGKVKEMGKTPMGYAADIDKKMRSMNEQLERLQQGGTDFFGVEKIEINIPEDDILKCLEQPLTSDGVDWRKQYEIEFGPMQACSLLTRARFREIACNLIEYGEQADEAKESIR